MLRSNDGSLLSFLIFHNQRYARRLNTQKMKLVLVLLMTCCLSVAFGAEAIESAPVTDPDLIKQGYTCQSSNGRVGLMKDGQVLTNYDPKSCIQAACHSGLVTYQTCGIVVASDNSKTVADLSKPYPDCCPTIPR